ncbi:transposase [Lunatimonas salinarum]|uniref:transposase n=1 Tax=Lunatimonas salinarum TaxID=1774590 RepID=UPI003157F5D8
MTCRSLAEFQLIDQVFHLFIFHRINGVEDHIHMAISQHPSISLANLIKDIKLASNKMIKAQGLFDDFEGWQEGYGAFTFGYSALGRVVDYIKNQEQHHRKVSSLEEYVLLLNEFGVNYDPRYLL